MTANPDHPLGPFTIDDNGLLRPSSANSFPAFRVLWRQRTMHTRLLHSHEAQNSGHLEFSGRLGRVPSTAGPAAAENQRTGALGLMRALPSVLPSGWEMNLSADHSVLVATTTPITLPISAISLVTKVTQFLLALAPYLDLLDAEGVTARGTTFAAGTVNT